MGTLYENIITLCNESHIKAGKMCNDIGMSRGLITDLKTGRKKSITVDTAKKIADYFGVSVDRVLNIDHSISEEQKKPALEKAELSALQKEALEFIKSLSDEQLKRFISFGKAMSGEKEE